MSINTTNNDNNTLLYQQLKIPQQIQIDRLKQEDDEQWISGEELCTEGSSTDSDDDKTNKDIKKILQQQKLQLQYQHKNKFKQKKHTNNIHNKRKYKPSPLLNDSTTKLAIVEPVVATNKNHLTVENPNMDLEIDDAGECSSWRWRPKRGSIKLPIDSIISSDQYTNDTTAAVIASTSSASTSTQIN